MLFRSVFLLQVEEELQALVEGVRRQTRRLQVIVVGQCLGVSQLNELLKVITDYYIAKGRVTSRADHGNYTGSASGGTVFPSDGKPAIKPEPVPTTAAELSSWTTFT